MPTYCSHRIKCHSSLPGQSIEIDQDWSFAYLKIKIQKTLLISNTTSKCKKTDTSPKPFQNFGSKLLVSRRRKFFFFSQDFPIPFPISLDFRKDESFKFLKFGIFLNLFKILFWKISINQLCILWCCQLWIFWKIWSVFLLFFNNRFMSLSSFFSCVAQFVAITIDSFFPFKGLWRCLILDQCLFTFKNHPKFHIKWRFFGQFLKFPRGLASSYCLDVIKEVLEIRKFVFLKLVCKVYAILITFSDFLVFPKKNFIKGTLVRLGWRQLFPNSWWKPILFSIIRVHDIFQQKMNNYLN